LTDSNDEDKVTGLAVKTKNIKSDIWASRGGDRSDGTLNNVSDTFRRNVLTPSSGQIRRRRQQVSPKRPHGTEQNNLT
jgi:hypothetical protein